MTRWVVVSLVMLGLGGLAGRAWGLIYLPENTLESLLVRADVVVIGTVTEMDEGRNKGTVLVEDVCKGEAKGTMAVTRVMLRVDLKTRKARFAKGERVVAFLGAAGEGGVRAIMHSQTLAGAAEVRTMKGCIAEVMPWAGVLADLGDAKKELKVEALRPAFGALVGSKNGYTQILVGRLMGTRMAEYVKPEGWERVVVAGVLSPRKELAKGALTWAGKYEKVPKEVREAVEKVAGEEGDEEVRKVARGMLGK